MRFSDMLVGAFAVSMALAAQGCGPSQSEVEVGAPPKLSAGMEKMKAEMLENLKAQNKGRLPGQPRPRQ